MSLYEYAHEFAEAIKYEDGKKLQQLLTISPADNQGPVRAHFSYPSVVDLYPVHEKFQPVFKCYLAAMKSIYISSNINESFVNLNELVVALNRAAESQSNWVCAALINCSDELMSLHCVRSKSKPGEQLESMRAASYAATESLELIAATVNKSFKICLTDKTYDFSKSKKASIHFFLATLIKIYFKLNKLELAKSVEKALLGTGLALPTIVNSPVEYRRHIITYLYFSSLLSLDQADFPAAEAKLFVAMQFLSCYKNQARVAVQAEKILLLLVPLKLLNSRTQLPERQWAKFPRLNTIYKQNIFLAIRSGNIRQFDEGVKSLKKVFLKRHIYVLINHLKQLCYLRLVQRTARIYGEINTLSPHIVPLSAFQLAIEYSLTNTDSEEGDLIISKTLANQNYSVTLKHVECILANLIHKKLVKGYLSHSNRCIVLSKIDPFPKVQA